MLLSLIVRLVSIEIIFYVSLTSFHSSRQYFSILLKFLLCFILLSCLSMHYWVLFILSTTFSRKPLPHASFFFWLHRTAVLNRSCATYFILPHVKNIYCLISLTTPTKLRFLRGAIIYYLFLCFSIPKNKISDLLIQRLKTNMCFLRILKIMGNG